MVSFGRALIDLLICWKSQCWKFSSTYKYLFGINYIRQPHASHVNVYVVLQKELWPKIVWALLGECINNLLFQDGVFTVNLYWAGRWFTSKCMLRSSSFWYLVLLVLQVMPCRSKLFSIMELRCSTTKNKFNVLTTSMIYTTANKCNIKCNAYFFYISLGEVKTVVGHETSPDLTLMCKGNV
jgi:hypothetical protein